MMLGEFRREHAAWPLPHLVHVSTPSYTGSHAEGYTQALRAIVSQIAGGGTQDESINVMPGLVSPADLRHLREIFREWDAPVNLLPDYADPLDGPAWDEWKAKPEGGTPLHEIQRMGRAAATLELGLTPVADGTAGEWLHGQYNIPHIPVVCATGSRNTRLKERLAPVLGDVLGQVTVLEDIDFATIEEAATQHEPDLIIGSSKGYAMARKLNVPLIRVGFPIHDRMGGARLTHLGYRGAQQLFDRIVNTLIETKQDRSPVGYFYM